MLKRCLPLILALLSVYTHGATYERQLCDDGTVMPSGGTCRIHTVDIETSGVDSSSANMIVQTNTDTGDYYLATYELADTGNHPANCSEVVVGANAADTSTKSLASTTTTFNSTDNVASLASLTDHSTFGCGVDGARNGLVTRLNWATLVGSGAGLEAGDAYFWNADGSDSNDCRTDATACLTGARSLSLSMGESADIYVEAGYTVPGTLTKSNSGNGTDDPAVVTTYCNDGGTMIAYDSENSACSAGFGTIENIVYTSNVVDSPAYDIEFNSVAGPIKVWNPGHYIQPKGAQMQENDQSTRATWYASDDLDDVEGVALYLRWAECENHTEGDFSGCAEYIDAELANLPEDKQLILMLDSQADNGETDGAYTFWFPQYLETSYNCVHETGKWIWGVWDSVCRDKFYNYIDFLAANYANNPRIEAIVITKETAIGNSLGGIGYSSGGAIAGWQAIIDYTVAAFPSHTVSIRINSRPSGTSEAALQGLNDYARDAGAANGGPDTAPLCYPYGSLGSNPIAEQECANTDTIGSAEDQTHITAYRYLHDNSYEGTMPSIYSVETSQTGNSAGPSMNKGYENLGFIMDYATDYLGATHLSWARRDFCYGGRGHEYVWQSSMSCSVEAGYISGVMDTFIAANPWPTENMACPESYNNNCWTPTYFGDDQVEGGNGGTIGSTLQIYGNAEGGYGTYDATQRADPGPGFISRSGGNSGDSPIADDTYAYAGDYSYYLRVGDTGIAHRSEITTNGYNRGAASWEGHEVFLGYAMRFPSTWPTGDSLTGLNTIAANQFHCETDNANCSSPIWAMLVRSSDGKIGVRQEFTDQANVNDFTLTSDLNVSDIADTWATVVWHVVFSTGSAGIIRLYINGTLEYEVTGVRTMQAGAGNFGFYKFGLYPSWHDDAGETAEQTKELWLDEIRLCTVGVDGCGYETVNPENYQ